MYTTDFGRPTHHPQPNPFQDKARDTDTVGRSSFDSDRYIHHNGHSDRIMTHYDELSNDPFATPEGSQYESSLGNETQITARRAASRRNSKLFTARVSRQKSRRRELLGRQAKLDTSFGRHIGDAPRQVFPEDDARGTPSSRKWFSVGRSSTKNKGLGITKGTPQPNTHRRNYSIDKNETRPGTKWEEISPWDRPIPIGMSVPTDSVSDFGPYKVPHQRSGSDTTLITPNIVVTPAVPAQPMQSVWSPDTPSDYTASIYSRNTYMGHNFNSADAPPVPALPSNVSKATVPEQTKAHRNPSDVAACNRNDTLDSAGTNFEEYDDAQRKGRVMSSDTFFEEDDTPLRERVVETTLAVDTSSYTPNARQSRGWWNVITTPFVATPLTATWPKNDRDGNRTPDMPQVPTQYGLGRAAPEPPAAQSWRKAEQVPVTNVNVALPQSSQSAPNNSDVAHSEQAQPQLIAVNAQDTHGAVSQSPNDSSTQQTRNIPVVNVISPQSSMAGSPPVTTAAATSSEARQVQEHSRPININIELQDRRPDIVQQANATRQVPEHTSWPAPRFQGVQNVSSAPAPAQVPQPLPVFAPPPTFARKGSHFSYDNASSLESTPDLKGKKKKHRKCKANKMMGFFFPWMFLCNKRKEKKLKKQQPQAGEVHNNSETEKKKSKRVCFFWCCGCCLLLLILLAILIPVLVVFLRRNNDAPTSTSAPTDTQPDTQPDNQPNSDMKYEWLNLTNYPPIPIGVLTVAQPEAIVEQSGCVAPTTLWSCALPKELHQSIKPNKPDQPNFKFEITSGDSTKASTKTRRVFNPASAGAFIRSRFLGARAAPAPSPAPPSEDDMTFLGRTTDSNQAPFQGEDTPLFITFKDTTTTASRLTKRRGPDDPTNITAGIPPPMLNSDGTAAPANLLPLPSNQPLRLYNRGKDTEHYAFYTYYDRSIFLKQINGTNRGGNPADVDGGSIQDAAALRCTFAQTRFLVQIWTRSGTSKPLLGQGGGSSRRPGSFPYPVTVTIDRHGGDAKKKNLYCYEMEKDGSILNEAAKRSFQFEDRAFGGNLVNGTQGRPDATGPIDGGSGGCRCQYQNWLE